MELETSQKRRIPLSADWHKTFKTRMGVSLAEKTGTEDPSGQIRALNSRREQLETHYREQLRLRAPDSLSCFVEYLTPDEPPAEHHEWMCDRLEAIERRDILRATFSMPPGHAKTKFCSRYFPAWYLGRNPSHRYLQGGHAQDFVESEYGQYVRDVIASPEYHDIFPEVGMDPASRASGRWRISGHKATSYVGKGVKQGIAGFRAHCCGIDDMFGSRKDAMSPLIREDVGKWLFSDVRPRLLPGSPWFLVGTRWHADDGIGRVVELTRARKGIPWEVYVLDAIIENEVEMEQDPLGRSIGEVLWKGFYTYEELMEIKSTSVSSDWWALYKNRPREEEGNVVKTKWFQRYKRLPANVDLEDGRVERNVKRITLSVDCAEKATKRSKYTACEVWIENLQGHHYLAYVERRRVEFVEMTKFINRVAADWNVGAILVEDAGNGTPYIAQHRDGLIIAPAPVIALPKPTTDSKAWRFDEVTPMFEAGEVWLPETARWLPEYEEEVLAFPNSTYTDQVDATSQYLKWARARRSYGPKPIKGTRHR